MRTFIAITFLVLLAAVAPRAHHSFGNFYLESDMIEVEGTIVEFQYKNPHAWVHVNGSEKGGGFGGDHVYSAEWVSTTQLERQGIEKTTLKPGDKVRIWGAPSKNPAEYKMHLKRMTRSDGWEWKGNRQNGGTADR